MNKVHYKGESFDYQTIVKPSGSRQYLLYKNEVLMHYVDEHELQRRPLICIIRGLADKEVQNSL